MLQDKNRSVPGKSKIVPRVRELAIEAKTDVEKRNYLFYMVIPFYNYMLKTFLHVQSQNFGDYYAECFTDFCAALKYYNTETSDNFIPLLKRSFKGYFINEWKSKRSKQDQVTSNIESFEPIVMEKYLKSIDNEFEFSTPSSGDTGKEKRRSKQKTGDSVQRNK